MSVDVRAGEGIGRRSLWLVILLPLLAFLIGLVAMGWLLSRWEAGAVYLGIAPPPVVQQPVRVMPVPAPVQQQAAAAPLPTGPTQRLVIDPETTRRVNRLEQRLAEIAQQSTAAAGNADRAEGLLVAFAARRALDRGVGLGYLEGLLQQRFGDTQRPAVATVITASRQPVTLEELQAGLKALGPELVGGGPDQDWWAALKHELAGLVIVRRSGAPSTLPSERLARAVGRMEVGQVDVALAEVLRMPGIEAADEWIAMARRYISARRALDTIETAALLDPRNPAQGGPAVQARLENSTTRPSL
jgi:hypothetical protein